MLISNRNLNIDILRCLSIFIVISSHFGFRIHNSLDGTVGVLLFFIISGYCIQRSIIKKKFLDFLKSRYLRLVPTFIICISFTAVFEYLYKDLYTSRYHDMSLQYFLSNIICIPFGNFPCDFTRLYFIGAPTGFPFVDGVYWSLLVEFRYYILLSLIFLICNKNYKVVIISLSLFQFLSLINSNFNFYSKENDFALYLNFFIFGMIFYLHEIKKINFFYFLIPILNFFILSFFGVQGISLNLNMNNFISYFSTFIIFIFIMILLNNKKNYLISIAGYLTYPVYLIHYDVGIILINELSIFLNKNISTTVVIFVIIFIAWVLDKTQILIVRNITNFFKFVKKGINTNFRV